jgi:putative copper export protein
LPRAFCWVGLSLLDASEDVPSLVSPAWWQTYLIEASFGRIWMLRLAGLVALLLCFTGGPGHKAPAGLIASLAWLGPAAADRGPQLFSGLFAKAATGWRPEPSAVYCPLACC